MFGLQRCSGRCTQPEWRFVLVGLLADPAEVDGDREMAAEALPAGRATPPTNTRIRLDGERGHLTRQ